MKKTHMKEGFCRGRAPLPAAVTAAALLLGAAPLALAGSATITTSDGNSAVFEYTDTMLRIGTVDQNGYALVRDGTLYAVSIDNGQAMVFDAGSMMRGFASTAAQIAPSDLNSEFLGMEKTGRSETIAGIKGDVYEIRFRDEDGVEQREEIVLSDDKLAREFRDALYLMLDVVADLASAANAGQSKDIQAQLASMDAGVLRFGQEMKLSAIDDRTVDASRFVLPAEPMNLEGLGGMLGGMGQTGAAGETGDAGDGKKGGLLSGMMGALGGKVDRQADRAGQSVENEIDKETDEQVDNAIGKAFGKLFRR